MVKFSKQFEGQLVPEWKHAFVDYSLLKKHLKRMQRYDRRHCGQGSTQHIATQQQQAAINARRQPRLSTAASCCTSSPSLAPIMQQGIMLGSYRCTGG
ncbi:hypothetical protein GUJ93_ZPchr0001g29425 [Zizania palustris]|uniref:SPX domain-containing protein n=1 Tax=Zizania palustris TaxID=103762 RepID=A0A8J5RHK7_ZIZPA|nr:hypothetical protein GUJ93_ZPchr0001g29425 [Zizania palustris]